MSDVRYHQKWSKVCTTPGQYQEWFEACVKAYDTWAHSHRFMGTFAEFADVEPVDSYPVLVSLSFGGLKPSIDYIYQNQIMELLGLEGRFITPHWIWNDYLTGKSPEPAKPEPEQEFAPAIEDRTI